MVQQRPSASGENNKEGSLSGKDLSLYEWGTWMDEQYDKANIWNTTLNPRAAGDDGDGDAGDE
jgi:hypothetical protein